MWIEKIRSNQMVMEASVGTRATGKGWQVGPSNRFGTEGKLQIRANQSFFLNSNLLSLKNNSAIITQR